MTKCFSIAAAQIEPRDGEVPADVEKHIKFIEAASREGVDLVVFPELSVTGYGVKFDSEMCFVVGDSRLKSIAEQCVRGGVSASVGVPLRMDGDNYIASMLFLPDGQGCIYRKQHLYGAEADFFVPGDRAGVFSISGVTVAFAICADSGVPSHAKEARESGAALYAVGAVSTKNGYEKKCNALQGYARLHGMNALLANFAGTTGGHHAVGGSAIWNSRSDVVARGPAEGECLVVGEMRDGVPMSGRVVCV